MVIIMCLVYAVSIADRYVVSTVLEPIRLDLEADRRRRGFPHRSTARLVLRLLRHSHVMARRPQQSAQHPGRFADRLVGLHRTVRTVAKLLAVPGGTHRRRHRRNRRHAAGELHHRRLLSGGSAAHGAGRIRARRAHRRVAGRKRGRRGRARLRLARGVSRPRHSGRDHGHAHLSRPSASPSAGAWTPWPTRARRPCSSRCDSCGAKRRPSTWSWPRGVCALWGWGLIWFTPAFLMRTYGLNVGEAGAVTGNIHLVGGIVATAATAWILSRPAMADPRRVVWLLAAGVGLDHHSFVHRLLDPFAVGGQMDVLAVHSGHLFLHRPVHGTDAESCAAAHARDVHRLVAWWSATYSISSSRRRASDC